ncbi:tRNA pseudouridine synthase-like 1 isoform X7 [Rhinolophus sinicus]|uniref:tRNA pseudouridine synthase-like 1 isoform X7 n=1 Tax=Rhinolophus sinicus TaxID=89399 RepID=UPI003D78B3EE
MGSGPAAGTVRARYLVYFQYLGTDFNGVAAVRGAQRAVGVQNYLEEAAERLKSVVPVKFVISSRTDAGVHALSNAAHLDVQRRSGQPPFSPEVLTQALNTHLKHPAIRCAPLGAPSSTAGRGGGQKGLRLDRTSWGNGTLVGRPPSGVPDLTPTGSCRPSVCTATSMPATQPHPGPTCTAWPPAAPGLTSCLCLNETDAGPCGQSEFIWMWPPCRRPPNTSWGLMTSAPSNRLAAHPLAQCAHCAEPQCPLTQPAPLSSPRRAAAPELGPGLSTLLEGPAPTARPQKVRLPSHAQLCPSYQFPLGVGGQWRPLEWKRGWEPAFPGPLRCLVCFPCLGPNWARTSQALVSPEGCDSGLWSLRASPSCTDRCGG